jgi:hypothetical protein
VTIARLIRPEDITILPLNADALVDEHDRFPYQHEREDAVEIPAQLDWERADRVKGESGGDDSVVGHMVLMVVDCDERSYAPKSGDLVTTTSYPHAGDATNSTALYIDKPRPMAWGKQWWAVLSTRRPARGERS